MSGINNAYDAFRTSDMVIVMKEKVEEMSMRILKNLHLRVRLSVTSLQTLRREIIRCIELQSMNYWKMGSL